MVCYLYKNVVLRKLLPLLYVFSWRPRGKNSLSLVSEICFFWAASDPICPKGNSSLLPQNTLLFLFLNLRQQCTSQRYAISQDILSWFHFFFHVPYKSSHWILQISISSISLSFHYKSLSGLDTRTSLPLCVMPSFTVLN